MPAFIAPPTRMPLLLRLGIWIAERMAGKTMLPARLLAWYPKAALGSAALEGFVAHRDGRLGPRMLKIVRLAASFEAACPFCIDMNSDAYREAGLTDEELRVLREREEPEAVPTFSPLERVAVRYARLISSTPLRFSPGIVAALTAGFTEREIVVLASTAAQVNYWARLIQALGVPPAGFSDRCEVRTPGATPRKGA